MKFKYIGDSPIKDVDLVVGGVFKPREVIVKGAVFDVPDDNKKLIQRVQLNGNYVVYEEPKKPAKPTKKSKKDDKKEKEEK